MTPRTTIPFCRSEFLQDVSIELGRRFASPPRPFQLSAEVDMDNTQEDDLERLTVWGFTPYETVAQLTLWADGTIHIQATLRATPNNGKYRVGFYPKCNGVSPVQIVECFRESVSVSTRLCYLESPLPLLRKIWKHRGKVEITGTLKKL